MNNINVTVELCPEDRARIDKLTEALTALASAKAEAVKTLHHDSKNDDIDQMLKKALHLPTEESPKNAPEAPEVLDHPTLNPFPETPTAAEEPSEAPTEEAEPTVTMEMLTNKALTLSANGKRDQVKEIVHVYAPKVTALPEDKWVEVYKKLTALEG